ncbi:MAG: peptide chain release factor N(5)-glutamine methyltransferase [Muribaculaceae bacterium]
MTLDQLNSAITRQLVEAYGEREGRAIARLLIEDGMGVNQVTLCCHGDRVLEPETVARLGAMADRVVAGEPVQYVLGKAHFMGLDLKVSPAVLIPRPETAGLVDLITDDYRGQADLRIMDVGTGSGCIAIALARALLFADIIAIDISPEALEIARENARSKGVNIRFEKVDILKAEMPERPCLDIVVSNPPYIAESEKTSMERNVLDYEPDTALFVPDEEPLLFYNAIARYAGKALHSGGKLYFEINPLFADHLKQMLINEGFSDVEILPDFVGRLRYSRATLKK